MKDILDDFSSDESLKASLLKGKRVQLAEELSQFICLHSSIISRSLERVRQIQEKLEEFVEALNTEK